MVSNKSCLVNEQTLKSEISYLKRPLFPELSRTDKFFKQFVELYIRKRNPEDINFLRKVIKQFIKIALAGRICYSANKPLDILKSDKRFSSYKELISYLNKLLKMKHLSVFRQGIFTIHKEDFYKFLTGRKDSEQIVQSLIYDTQLRVRDIYLLPFIVSILEQKGTISEQDIRELTYLLVYTSTDLDYIESRIPIQVSHYSVRRFIDEILRDNKFNLVDFYFGLLKDVAKTLFYTPYTEANSIALNVQHLIELVSNNKNTEIGNNTDIERDIFEFLTNFDKDTKEKIFQEEKNYLIEEELQVKTISERVLPVKIDRKLRRLVSIEQKQQMLVMDTNVVLGELQSPNISSSLTGDEQIETLGDFLTKISFVKRVQTLLKSSENKEIQNVIRNEIEKEQNLKEEFDYFLNTVLTDTERIKTLILEAPSTTVEELEKLFVNSSPNVAKIFEKNNLIGIFVDNILAKALYETVRDDLLEQVIRKNGSYIYIVLDGVSRNLTHQIVRHSLYTAFTQRSLRYVNEGKNNTKEDGNMTTSNELFSEISEKFVVPELENYKEEIRFANELINHLIAAGLWKELFVVNTPIINDTNDSTDDTFDTGLNSEQNKDSKKSSSRNNSRKKREQLALATTIYESLPRELKSKLEKFYSLWKEKQKQHTTSSTENKLKNRDRNTITKEENESTSTIPNVEIAEFINEFLLAPVRRFIETYGITFEEYKTLMERDGVKKEDARFVLPTGIKSVIAITFYGRGLENFLIERAFNNHAQWEIRNVAKEILRVLLETKI